MRIALFFPLLFLVATLSAQNQIQVTPLVFPPYPSEFSEYLSRTGEPILTLTNIDPAQFPYEIKIGLEIIGNNGISLSTDFEKQPLQPWVLLPGQSITLTADEILDNYSNHTQNDITVVGIDVQQAIQSQTIPEGIYQACITVYDYYTNEPLSLVGCTPMIPINVLDPPIITSPSENEEIPFSENPFIEFQWTPIVGAQVAILYDFELVEVPQGVNPYDLFDSPNGVFMTDEVAVPFLNYDATYPSLEAGQTYAARVRAYDAGGQTQINNNGYSDIVVFRYGVPQLTVPDWIYPEEEASVSITNVDYIDFDWERNYQINEHTQYNFLLLEYPIGTDLQTVIENPQDYMAGLAYNLPSSTYRHNLLESPLTGERYVAWFIAIPPDNRYVFENDGYSSPRVFYTSKTNSINNGGFAPLEVGDGTCASCVRRPPTLNTPASNLQIGDTIRAGNFLMRIATVRTSNNGFNGTATNVPFGEMPIIAFDFENLKVNQIGEMLSGRMVARRGNITNMPEDWLDINTEFGNYSNRVLYQARSSFRRLPLNPALSTIPFKLSSDVIVTALELGPTQAKGNFVHLKKMYGGLPAVDDELLFGIKNHCFNNGGPATAGLQLRIPLIKRIDYKRADDYEIHFLTGTDERSLGTHMTYSCQEGIAYHLYGGVRFGLASNLTYPQGGQDRVAAFFDGEVSNLNNFIIDLDLGNPVRRRLIGGSLSRQFAHPALPGMKLKVIDRNLVLDHSVSRNIDDLGLPIGATTTSNAWRGIVLPIVNITLPQSFSRENGQDLQRTVEGMILDANGFSINTMFTLGQIERPEIVGLPNTNLNVGQQWQNTLNGINRRINLNNDDEEDEDINYSDIQMGGWPAGIGKFELVLAADEFETAKLLGFIKPPFLADRVPYNATLRLNENETGFDFLAHVETQNTALRIPSWKATLNCEDNGSLQIRTLNEQMEVVLTLSGDLNFEEYPERKVKVDFQDIKVNDLRIANRRTTFGNIHPLVNAASFEIGEYDYQINSRPVELLNIHLDAAASNLGLDRHELVIDYAINLGEGQGNQPAIGVETDLSYHAAKQIAEEEEVWQLDSVSISPIRIPREIMPSYADNLEGTIKYEPVDRQGNWGFRSNNISGEFGVFTNGSVTMEAIFGSTTTGKSFWSLQADVDLGIARIPFMPGIYISGLGGGLYSNMEKINRDLSNGYRNYDLIPLRNGSSFGLEMNTSWETENPQTLNGRFGVETNFLNASLSNVQFNGIAHFMDQSPPGNWWTTNVQPRENTWVSVWGNINFNIAQRALSGSLGYDVDIGNNNFALTGRRDRAVEFNLQTDKWWLYIGRPHAKFEPFGSGNIYLNFAAYMQLGERRVRLFEADHRGYFCIGSQMPAGSGMGWGLAYGKRISFGFTTPRMRVWPWRDRAYAGLEVWASVNGDVGMYDRFCGLNGPRFGFRLGAELGIKGYVKYYDVCDMPFEKDCGYWDKYSASMTVKGGLHGPKPIGGTLSFDIGVWEWEGTLGQKCN